MKTRRQSYSTFRAMCHAAGLAVVLGVATSAQANILLNETFDTDVSGWYWNTGSFISNAGEADSGGTSWNQLFTTSFAPTTLAAGEKLSVSFNYTPVTTTMTSLRVGLWNGAPVTATGFTPFTGSGESRDWGGYYARMNTTGTLLRFTPGTPTYDNPVSDGTTLSSGSAVFAADNTQHAVRLTLENTGSGVSVKLEQGSSFGSLSTVLTGIDTTGLITSGLQNVGFYHSDTAASVVRYDNVTVEYIPVPEPTTGALLALVGAGFFARRVKRMGSAC
jgi:hypothetical protein